ncbi:hypothetical protein [Pseudoalteromonas luteoviolacea]|uniref:Porin domain-containing protein n=1 Tax=Pseudoalteromonas luteoviolacea S4060-1 TaxID=1365257 RepID=A0A162CF34_9GAMM|nr:hypothetical protein [Pseudoalteromonas luteoviolacea]KZN66906.1 hypothetical protein N478_18945 [Pseudoalteromonas luteoviolacea S4060-1]
MKYTALCSAAILLAFSHFADAEAWQQSGEIQVQQRIFVHSVDPGNDAPEHWQGSAMIEPHWQQVNDTSLTSVKLFARIDSHDKERTHWDIRELSYLTYWDDYELKFGIDKVFWGVTESQHLVDVINQTDSVEGFDGEDKLGQPMAQFKAVKDIGTFDLWLLPYFRERTLPSREGRLALPAPLLDAKYESSSEQRTLDFAIRYSHTLEDWDIGLSYFDGTNRDPYLQYTSEGITPFYAQMWQLGTDIQGVFGDWLVKLEAIHRDSLESHFAMTTGFEYTQVGIFDTVMDLGWIAEYSFDERNNATNQNDLFIGWRLALNDMDGYEVLFGVNQDLDSHHVFSAKLEASGRLNDSWKWQLDAWTFTSDQPSDPIYILKDEDFIEVSLTYFF